MIRRLVLISILLLPSVVICAQEPTGGEYEYSVLIQARGREMSGICMAQTSEDGSVIGTILTEFGVKIFDFTYTGSKTRVMNVIAPMNKWYIRKVIRKDMKFLVESKWLGFEDRKPEIENRGMRTLSCKDDGSFTVDNNRYNIHYSFSPLK